MKQASWLRCLSGPVEFLSDEQAGAYGRFLNPPSREQLERFFWLNDADQARAGQRRRDATALGFAVQLGTVRFLGTFLADPLNVPWPGGTGLPAGQGPLERRLFWAQFVLQAAGDAVDVAAGLGRVQHSAQRQQLAEAA